jgi:tetratricopeptide (TPR) repeat protein
VVLSPVRQAQYRLAQHYLNQLHKVNQALLTPGRHQREHWLNGVQEEWAQIQHWYHWAAVEGAEPERTHMVVAFVLEAQEVLRAQQLPSEHLHWVAQALRAAAALGEHSAEKTLLYQQALLWLNTEQLVEAEASARQLLNQSQQPYDELSQGRALHILGDVASLKGQYDQAEAHYQSSDVALEQHRSSEEMARVWSGLGRLALFRGRYDEAKHFFQQHLLVVTKLGNERLIGGAHLSLSGILNYQKDYTQSESHALQSLTIARRTRVARLEAHALVALANAERLLGKLSAAQMHFESAIESHSVVLPASSLVIALSGLARTYRALGDITKADVCGQRAFEEAKTSGLPMRICETANLMVEVCIAQQALDKADWFWSQSAQAALRLDTLPFLTRTLFVRFRLAYARQQYQQAALCVGSLTRHISHVDSDAELFSVLCDDLSRLLDEATYQRAIAQGAELSPGELVRTLASSISPC